MRRPNGFRHLRSPSVAAGVALLAVALALPATASARSSITIAGASAKRLRLCGAVHKTMSVQSGARVVASIRRLPRGARTLTISRCGAGRWHRFKKARITHRRVGRSAKVRLPRLPAGGYRVTGPDLTTLHLRVVRAAAAPQAPLLDRAAVRAPMVAFCEGPDGDGDGPHRSDATKLPVDARKLIDNELVK